MAEPRDVLERRCLAAIEAALSDDSRFDYTKLASIRIPDGFDASAPVDAKQLSRMIGSFNNLHGAIVVKPFFTLAAGVYKTLVLCIDWTVYDTAGGEAFSARTVVHAAEKVEILPDTREDKHHDLWVGLTTKSAEDFLLMLAGDKPRHSQELPAMHRFEYGP